MRAKQVQQAGGAIAVIGGILCMTFVGIIFGVVILGVGVGIILLAGR